MKVTNDVILDVWPLYEAGEVSMDTKALVEGYLAAHPEFGRTLRQAAGAARQVLGATSAPAVPRQPGAVPTAPAQTSAPAVVDRVRRRLARQRWLTGRSTKDASR